MCNRTATYQRDAAFQALADPSRRAILDLLRLGILPAGQIARSFSVSRPAVSKHLRLLRRAGLVEQSRQGRNRFYRLSPAPLKEVDSWLQEYREFWSANLTGLKTFVESGSRAEERVRQTGNKNRRRGTKSK